MTNRTVLGFAVVAVASMIAGSCSDEETTTPPVEMNRVELQSITVAPGDEVKMDIKIHNEVTIMGVEVPLKYSGEGCTVDQVSFSDGDFDGFLLTTADTDERECVIDVICADGEPPVGQGGMPPGDWVLASVYFSISPTAPDGVIRIEKTEFVEGNLQHILSFATSDLQTIYPAFVSGEIHVVAPPIMSCVEPDPPPPDI